MPVSKGHDWATFDPYRDTDYIEALTEVEANHRFMSRMPHFTNLAVFNIVENTFDPFLLNLW